MSHHHHHHHHHEHEHHQEKTNVASLIQNFEQQTQKDQQQNVLQVPQKKPDSKPVTQQQVQPSKPSSQTSSKPSSNQNVPTQVPQKKPLRRLMTKRSAIQKMLTSTNVNDQPLGNEFYTPNLNNDPSINTVRVGDKNISFVNGWQHKDANQKFSDSSSQLQYAANLEHGVYLKLQDKVIGDNTNEVTRDFVVDLDGQVDQIIIPDYPTMQSMGTEFSIEFWLRVSTFPLAQNNLTVFSRGNTSSYCRFSVLPAGQLKLESGHTGAISTILSSTNAIKEGAFNHVAITGSKNVVTFYVDAKQVGQGSLGDVLAGKGSPFIFGCDATSSTPSNFFCGQITALYIYNYARTADTIKSTNASKSARSDANSLLGQWALSSSNRIYVTCYFVTPSDELEDQTESDFAMTHKVLPMTTGQQPADVPCDVIVEKDTIYLFRQTTKKQIVVDVLTLANDTLTQVTGTQTLNLSADCNRGWFAAVRVNTYWIVFNCGSCPTFLSTDGDSVIWQTFQEDGSHNFSLKSDPGFSGRIAPKTANKTALHFTTHPSVTFSNGHVVLTASSDDSARIMMFDFLVTDSKLASVNGDLIVDRVGPNWDDTGTLLYVTFSQPNSGIAPTQSTLPPSFYSIKNPDYDFRYGTLGKIVRLRHTQFGEGAPIQPPMSVLCGIDYNADGTTKTVDVHSQDIDAGAPVQQYVFRMVNLSKPRSTTFADGDAVSFQVFVPRGEGQNPLLNVVEWQMLSQADFKPDQTCTWHVNSSVQYTGKATSMNQVFGIYGVDYTTSDDSSPLAHTPSDMRRILIVPGVYANAIDPSMASGISQLGPTNPDIRDDEMVFTYTMQQSGMPLVYVDSFGMTSISVFSNKSSCSSYYLCHAEKNDNDDNDRRSFEWLQRQLVNDAFMEDKVITSVDNNTNPFNWSWYSWRISTPHGGYTLKSGQEVLVEGFGADNDSNTADRWQRLNKNMGQWKVTPIGDDEKRWHYNFWIFKVTAWTDTTKTIVRDSIHSGDWVMLWPRSEKWANKFFASPIPTPADIQAAIAEFNSTTDVFLMQPYQMMYTKASVLPGEPDVNKTNQNAEKKLDNIAIAPSSSVTGLWTGLLNFARSVTVPQIETYNNAIRLTFRGNGHPLLLANGLVDPSTVDLENNHDFFQEGAIGQTLMTTGLYYKIDYYPVATGNSSWTGMAHVDNLAKYEFAVPPPNFQWTTPPPYKVTGLVELIANFSHRDWTLNFLPKVIRSIVGRGTYHEGMWKPTLTIPIDNDKVNAVRVGAQNVISGRIKDKIGDWQNPDFDVRDNQPVDSYYTLADLVTARAFESIDFWKGKIDAAKVDRKYSAVMKGDWFKSELRTVTQQLADQQVALLAPTYAAYGGPIQIIAALLTSDAFINQLMLMDMKAASAIVNTHLAVLSTFNPEVAGSIGGTLMTSMCANKMVNDPGSIMNSLTADQREQALEQIVIALVQKEGKDPDSDLSIYALKVFLAIATSSSLGTLIELRNQQYELTQEGKDAVKKMNEDPDIWNPAATEKFPSDETRGRVKSLIPDESWPKVKTGLGLIATGCSYYSLGMMIKDWQGTDQEKVALAGQVIGSVSGTLDTLKLARDFGKSLLKIDSSEWRFGERAPAAIAESTEDLTTLAKVGSKLSEVVDLCGPIADGISLGLSVYSLITDVQNGSDAYTIGMDSANLALGVAGIAASLGMMAGAAFAGPLAAAVVVAAVVLVIIDACKSSEEQEEEEKKAKEQKEKRQKWIDWSRHILTHQDVIIPGTDDPSKDDDDS